MKCAIVFLILACLAVAAVTTWGSTLENMFGDPYDGRLTPAEQAPVAN